MDFFRCEYLIDSLSWPIVVRVNFNILYNYYGIWGVKIKMWDVKHPMRKINKRIFGTGVEKIEFQKTAIEEYNRMRKNVSTYRQY